MSHPVKSKEIAEYLARRAQQDQEISVAEFRRLFLMGLGALLREADSISYTIKQAAEKQRFGGSNG
jgi:hypothetical protein